MKDYQQESAKHYCELCGGEIYSLEDYYLICGKIICENCVEDCKVNGEEEFWEDEDGQEDF